jgi:hypothetical protein
MHSQVQIYHEAEQFERLAMRLARVYHYQVLLGWIKTDSVGYAPRVYAPATI